MITIPRRKAYHKPLVWQKTHELVKEIAEKWERWELNLIEVYHLMALVASKFDSAEEFAALAESLQPEQLQETDNG